jgi:hypothetical protein
MAASDASHVSDENGLSTAACFEYLLELKRKHPTKRMVGFGLSYDVNMMLRDLHPNDAARLWEKGKLFITLDNGIDYRMEWIPGKTFAVCRAADRKWARISDVFGFFQMSFVRSLEKWDVPDPGGHIARMKAQRGSFKFKDIDSVLSYCVSECNLLTELMQRLEASLDSANLVPARWIGAGAVAARMLRTQGVANHRVADTDFPDPVHYAIMHAYFGGRSEVFLQGKLSGCVNYDINSAYPFEALSLPSLVGGSWRRSRFYDESAQFALWRVRWDVPGSNFVMPFPLRKDGGIYYPEAGTGWYHAKEVRAAMKLYAGHIEVQDGWIFEPANDVKPFDFIREKFEERLEAKRAGHASEKALKLGLNALYGKLAQGFGWQGRTPPFQSFYWAGAITSGTRGTLLRLARENLSGVVSMATDGIVFSGDPNIVASDGLGGFDKTIYQDIFVAQPGIYKATKDNGEVLYRTRGFFVQEIDWPDLERGWLMHGPTFRQFSESTRFIGLGSALMRADLSEWRTWATSERCLNLYSSRKFYDERVSKGRVMRLYPPRFPGFPESEVYKPKGRGLEMAKDAPDFVQGLEQPMYVL